MSDHVTVSLTTIPTRLNADTIFGSRSDGIMSCLNSLLSQSYDNYEVHFNIPLTNKQTGDEYIIPNWLLDLEGDILKIFRTDDYGSVTKLAPTLSRLTDPEEIIIICDDDLVYHKDMVSEQAQNQSKFPGCAVGYDGIRLKVPVFNDIRDYYFSSCRLDAEVIIIQGYKTISYRRKYFEDDFFPVFLGKSWNDDIVISSYLAFRNIKKMVTFYEGDPVLNSLEEWEQGGGVTTFPVLRHTAHESLEGCNLKRSSPEDESASDPFLWHYLDSHHLE